MEKLFLPKNELIFLFTNKSVSKCSIDSKAFDSMAKSKAQLNCQFTCAYVFKIFVYVYIANTIIPILYEDKDKKLLSN